MNPCRGLHYDLATDRYIKCAAPAEYREDLRGYYCSDHTSNPVHPIPHTERSRSKHIEESRRQDREKRQRKPKEA